MAILLPLLALSLQAVAVHAICYTYATNDIPYDSTLYFAPTDTNDLAGSFYFQGCAGQGTGTTQLLFPDGSTVACSDVSNTADGYETITCPVVVGTMPEGQYTLSFDGPEGGAYDIFTVTHEQATVTLTPTATVTSYPSTTTVTTTTSTETDTVDLVAVTTVLPAATKGTVTIYPHPVTVTVTKTFTKTHFGGFSYVLTSTVKTITATCVPTPVHQGPCPFRPKVRGRTLPIRKRGGDGPLTTSIYETTYTSVVTVQGTSTTFTNTETDFDTVTVTVTPPVVTSYSGTVKATTTEPTKTRTKVSHTCTVITKPPIVHTFTATIYSVTTPKGVTSVCRH